MRKAVVCSLLVLFVVLATPVFADVSIDLGATTLGNAVYLDGPRPAGATVALGLTMFDYTALVQACGSIFAPPLGDAYSDPAASISAGVLFSPLEYVYLGLRTGMISPTDDIDFWTSYSSMVVRVQNQGKGLHFFAETEISFNGLLNKFAAGLNFTF